jgi:hypothetical protein
MKVKLEENISFAVVRYNKIGKSRKSYITWCSYRTIEEAEKAKDDYIKSTDDYCNCDYEYRIIKATYKKELI